MTAGEEQVEKRKDLPTYTLAEVKKHNTPKDLWIAINGAVYDVTKFQDRHPGGSSSLTDHAGTDATDDFMSIHSTQAKNQLPEYIVGYLPETEGVRKTGGDTAGSSALSYLVPVLVLGVAIWYQFLGGAEMLKESS